MSGIQALQYCLIAVAAICIGLLSAKLDEDDRLAFGPVCLFWGLFAISYFAMQASYGPPADSPSKAYLQMLGAQQACWKIVPIGIVLSSVAIGVLNRVVHAWQATNSKGITAFHSLRQYVALILAFTLLFSFGISSGPPSPENDPPSREK